MVQLLKMGLRDLMRNKRRSILSALALGVGLALLLLMVSFVKGEIRSSMEASIRLQSGHLQIRAESYDENKTSLQWKDLIEDPDALVSKIQTLGPVKIATPRLFASGIIAVQDRTVGVRVTGIDPNSEANAPFTESIVSGVNISAEDQNGILIGQTLAEKLDVQTGGQVNMMVNTANGDVDQQIFTVRGIYTTHIPGFDQNMVFMPLAKTQAMTRTENHASTIFIMLKDQDQTDAVVQALQTSQYQVKTWKQMNELLVETEDYANAMMYVLYLIVLGITATVIVNTLVMSVFERTREIGILSAIGMRSSRIMQMFFMESGMLAVGGIVIGWVIGSLLVGYTTVYGFRIGNLGITGFLLGDTIYSHLTAADAITLTIITFLTALAAAIYPAVLAARMEPVQALHGGK
jgi:ABC-type lipoprotein release transport system permease subunit